MSLSKNQKPFNEKSMNGKPMHEWVYQSIMGEYLLCPDLYLEDERIRKAYAMNDEVMLRKILECEY